jgi:phage FluMu protein Com
MTVEVGYRECSNCNKVLPETDFRFIESSQRWTKMCEHCREVNNGNQKIWRAANPEEANRRSRISQAAWRLEHLDEARAATLKCYRERMAKLTLAERRAIYRKSWHDQSASLKRRGLYEAHLKKRRILERERYNRKKIALALQTTP